MSISIKPLNEFELKSIFANLKDERVFEIKRNSHVSLGLIYIFLFNYKGFVLSASSTLVSFSNPDIRASIEEFISNAKHSIEQSIYNFESQASRSVSVSSRYIDSEKKVIMSYVISFYRNLSGAGYVSRSLLANHIKQIDIIVDLALNSGAKYNEAFLNNFARISFNKQQEILDKRYVVDFREF